MYAHQPVLLEEVLRLLSGCRRVLDGTAGGGGHAGRLAEAGIEVLAVDRDPVAVAAATERLKGQPLARVMELDYSDAAADATVRAFRPDGLLLDLGVSSPQIDDDQRGFTFRQGVPLDMRMGGADHTAADWLNSADQDEVEHALRVWADEPRARRLAGEIVRRRENRPFVISDDLVGAIRATLGPGSGPPDFARIFQAVRIVVNGELERLERALPELRDLLEPGGVMAVISYHSGEDRLVKHAFREWSRSCVCPEGQPICNCRGRSLGELLTRKSIDASAEEQQQNPRARSAHLRAFRTAAV